MAEGLDVVLDVVVLDVVAVWLVVGLLVEVSVDSPLVATTPDAVVGELSLAAVPGWVFEQATNRAAPAAAIAHHRPHRPPRMGLTLARAGDRPPVP